ILLKNLWYPQGLRKYPPAFVPWVKIKRMPFFQSFTFASDKKCLLYKTIDVLFHHIINLLHIIDKVSGLFHRIKTELQRIYFPILIIRNHFTWSSEFLRVHFIHHPCFLILF